MVKSIPQTAEPGQKDGGLILNPAAFVAWSLHFLARYNHLPGLTFGDFHVITCANADEGWLEKIPDIPLGVTDFTGTVSAITLRGLMEKLCSGKNGYARCLHKASSKAVDLPVHKLDPTFAPLEQADSRGFTPSTAKKLGHNCLKYVHSRHSQFTALK